MVEELKRFKKALSWFTKSEKNGDKEASLEIKKILKELDND